MPVAVLGLSGVGQEAICCGGPLAVGLTAIGAVTVLLVVSGKGGRNGRPAVVSPALCGRRMRHVGRGLSAVSSESQRAVAHVDGQTAVRLLFGRGRGNAGRAITETGLVSRRHAIEAIFRRRTTTLHVEGAPVYVFSGRCRRCSKAREAMEGRSPKSSCTSEMGGPSSPGRGLFREAGAEIAEVCPGVEVVPPDGGGRSTAFQTTQTIAVKHNAATTNCEVAGGLPVSAALGRRVGRVRAVSGSEVASSTAPTAITGASIAGRGRCRGGRLARDGTANATPAVTSGPSKKGGVSRLRRVQSGADVTTREVPGRAAESESRKHVAPSRSRKMVRPAGRRLASRLIVLLLARLFLRQEASEVVSGASHARVRMCQAVCRH